MSSRPDSRRRSAFSGLRFRFRPEVVQLEDRATPATLTWNTPSDGLQDDVRVTLGKSNKIEIYDNGVLVQFGTASKVDLIIINGNADRDNLTVDYSAGFFKNRIDFNAGATVVDDTISVTADLDFTLTDAALTNSGGGMVTLLGVDKAEITGGGGNNTINASGFSGVTVLKGEGGNDTIFGGSGNDTIFGGDGFDVINITTGGSDTVETGNDDDTIIYKLSSEITALGGGTPGILAEVTTITNSHGIDSIVAGSGQTQNTILNLDSEFLTIQTSLSEAGALAVEQLTFTGPYGTVGGGSGDDTYNFNANLAGGTPGVLAEGTILRDAGGNDRLNLTNLTTVTANLDPVNGFIISDVSIQSVVALLQGTFENVDGTSGNDTFFGNAANNVFDGRGGSDSYTDHTSNDADIIVLEALAGPISINLGVADGVKQKLDAIGNSATLTGDIEGVIGTDGDDTLSGDNGRNYLFGGLGNDVLQGQGGDDILVGGGGVDDLNGGDGKDILIGGSGADRIKGNSDEDILVAGIYIHDTDLDTLLAIQSVWTGGGTYENRVNILRTYLNTSTVHDDGEVDTLTGSQSRDWFIKSATDVITDQVSSGKSIEFVDPEGVPL